MMTLKIIKIGGNVIDDDSLLNQFIVDFTAIEGNKILIHGGGKSATNLSKKLNINPVMIAGRRVTDGNALDLVVMVYAGLINKNIVARLQKEGCNAIGLSGADGNSILAHKRLSAEHDYGFAGDIDHINTSFISNILENGLVPVFSAITHDKQGQLLNTNADTIAASLASALADSFNTQLFLVFEHDGVMINPSKNDSIIGKLSSSEYKILLNTGLISGGMIPKLDNGFEALKNGVNNVFVGSSKIVGNQSACTQLILA